jgi:hypothetical protein
VEIRAPPFSTLCHPTSYVVPPRLLVFLEAVSVLVAEPEVFALVSVAAELSPEGVVLAAEPGVVPVAADFSPAVVVWVAAPEVVFAAVVVVADVAGPPVAVDIAVAVVVSVPGAVVVVEVDSSGRSTFLAVPNVELSASSASSVEVVGEESVHSSTGARTNYGLGSSLATRGRHQNKNWAHGHNTPSPGYKTVSDTTALPRDATTTHSRKTSRHR